MADDDGGRGQSYYDSNDGGAAGGSRMAKATAPSEFDMDLDTYEQCLEEAITNESDKWNDLVDVRDNPKMTVDENHLESETHRRWGQTGTRDGR